MNLNDQRIQRLYNQRKLMEKYIYLNVYLEKRNDQGSSSNDLPL